MKPVKQSERVNSIVVAASRPPPGAVFLLSINVASFLRNVLVPFPWFVDVDSGGLNRNVIDSLSLVRNIILQLGTAFITPSMRGVFCLLSDDVKIPL